MKIKFLIPLLLVLTAPMSQAAGIYRYVDDKGRISFSDKQRHDGYVPMVQTWKGWQELRPPANLKEGVSRYRPLVVATADRYAIAPELVSAIIHAESHFNPVAVSDKGAVGLMQLMPATATRYGVDNRQDPKQNIEGGIRYLRDLMAMFNNKTELAVAAYNAGENAVKKQGNRIPPYPETKNYVKKVLALYDQYKKGRY